MMRRDFRRSLPYHSGPSVSYFRAAMELEGGGFERTAAGDYVLLHEPLGREQGGLDRGGGRIRLPHRHQRLLRVVNSVAEPSGTKEHLYGCCVVGVACLKPRAGRGGALVARDTTIGGQPTGSDHDYYLGIAFQLVRDARRHLRGGPWRAWFRRGYAESAGLIMAIYFWVDAPETVSGASPSAKIRKACTSPAPF